MPQPSINKQPQSSFFSQYISKFRGSKRKTPLVAPVPLDIIITFIGAFLALSPLCFLTFHFQLPLLTASLGASATLVFGSPDGPLSQPRNVILGNTLSATVGVITYHTFGLSWWSVALGTSLAILVMILTKTTHPPGGATALFVILYKMDPIFILAPVLIGTIFLVIVGVIINNLSPNRSYPRYWY